MSEKQELIQKMLEMQRKFIDYEHEHGISADEYYTPPQNHPLHQYREQYAQIASRLIDLAHQEKGSKR